MGGARDHDESKKYKKKTPTRRNKKKPLQNGTVPFIDRIHIKTRGGVGGRGGQAYHSLGSYKKKPCGGHGGHGGDVYIVTDPTLTSLKMERHHFFGQDGGKGGASGMNGKNGRDTYVRVPCGVVVRRVLDWEEMDELYAEENEELDVNVEDGATAVGGDFDGAQSFDEIDDDSDSDSDSNDDSSSSDEGEESESSSDEEDTDINDDHSSSDESEESESSSDEEDTDLEDKEDHDIDAMDGDPREDIDYQEEDFETYLERVKASSKKKRSKLDEDELPPDYDEVVDTGVRSEDGMYHWSSEESPLTEDDQMASTAYGDFLDSPNRPTRKTVFMADLDKPRTSVLVAAGGKQGIGNISYSKMQHFAGMEAQAAKKAVSGEGESTFLELELKMIADVGLVGFPNAGKSSLLSAMSRASPKIAAYPFTTLHPLVGTIRYRDGFNLVMADVPGLIDGAAEGRGRGTEFLRHIERTKALVYMVDGAGVDGRDPVNDLRILGKELKEYGSSGIFGENEMDGEGEYGEEVRRRREEIMNRPSLILANKMDLISEEDAIMGKREELHRELLKVAKEVGIACEYDDILETSARVTGEGLQVLSKRLRQIVTDAE